MTTTPHPYPALRPSGVQWLRDVPSHWEVLPRRACYTSEQILNKGILEEDRSPPELWSNQKGILYGFVWRERYTDIN